MDPTQFDLIARGLGATSSRRRMTRALSALALGGAPASLVGLAGGAAKKKKKNKKSCRNCGSCRTCRNGACVPKLDGISCEGTKTCSGGVCACGPGTTEVDGRCTEPCGPTCQAPCNCRVAVASGANFCARDIGLCANRIRCTSNAGCATNEICALTGCPPDNGITNKCVVLC